MTDKRCSQPTEGRRVAFDSERAMRLILASLNEDRHASQVIADEIDDCPNCLRGVIDFLVGAFIGLAESFGDRETVIGQVEKELAKALNTRADGAA